VILVPSLKFGELLTDPVIDPSAFCVHRLITGILSLGAALAAGLLGAALAAGLFPNKDKVDRGAGAGAAGRLAAGFGAEKRDRVGRAAVFFGMGVEAAFGAEKRDRLGRGATFFGAEVGVGLGAGAVLGLPKNEKG
jgi:hypothetical protein